MARPVRVRIDQPVEGARAGEDVLEEHRRAIGHVRSSNSACMLSSGAHSHDGIQVEAYTYS